MTTPFTSEEFTARRQRLQAHLQSRGIDAAILNVNTDIYYYTGTLQPLYLLVPAGGEAVVLARKSIARIREESDVPLETFSGTKDLVDILTRRLPAPVKTVGFTLDVTAYVTINRFQQLLPGIELADLSWDIRTLRMVKSPAEIAIQRQAGALMGGVPDLVRERFTPGMSELELSAIIEHYFRLRGNGALMRCRKEGIEMSGVGVCTAGMNSLAGTKFDGICGGVGVSPAVPYGATIQPIPRNLPVVLDFGFTFEGYLMDQTRIMCWGEIPDKVQRAYDAMVQIQHAVVADLTPGRSWDECYTKAVAMADALGYADTFMGVGEERVKFIGHGVGLELDEPPFLAPRMPYPLEAGMVIAIEPKVALPGIGVVGIEDTFLVTDAGAEQFTSAPIEIIRI